MGWLEDTVEKEVRKANPEKPESVTSDDSDSRRNQWQPQPC
jgi:hypothetical protein